MASEPVLPPLIAGGGDNSSLADSAFEGSSSDPAVFSSDDLRDASCDDYVSSHRKRLYRGAWWGLNKTRRKLRRTIDSGVFMGSEGTDGSADDVLEELHGRSPLSTGINGEVRRPSAQGGLDIFSLASQRRQIQTISTHDNRFHPYSPASIAPRIAIESRADNIIGRCLEGGVDRVDLSGQRLNFLSNSTISQLKHLVKTPQYESASLDSDSFESMIPSIDLQLQSNLLRSLPSALFQLEHLTILNLRYNYLSELHPAIANLTNLEELHLDGNDLRYLPYEILKLLGKDGKLRRLLLCSNPLLKLAAEPIAGQTGLLSAADAVAEVVRARAHARAKDAEKRESVPAGEQQPSSQSHPSSNQPEDWEPRHLISTSLKLLAIDGSLYTNPTSTITPPCPIISSSAGSSLGVATPGPPSSVFTSSSVSAAPSLFETALRVCHSNDALEHLPALLPLDTPESVSRALRETLRIKESEDERVCTVCGKWYLLPRTEWIEWWDCIPPPPGVPRIPPATVEEEVTKTIARAVPLIRKGCSWACRPGVPPRTEKAGK
ncbi:hypothetical protein L228DRAFT_251375 [Xylona heveae TC161]|uniref:L domain-like protein n=1 Tax=Xylona heveae (strain CBS 132557 / TC161) TaxID=1328760 RepID=A0A164ZLZ0_XYLHT|nr:hypothetical protein L228DRAFT_251375 [Xylona heveae TC161]KZF19259.1 hypothetical protein L228DRAFT_251375 [Xylona heveae TC161]